jgi:hypothetical protein
VERNDDVQRSMAQLVLALVDFLRRLLSVRPSGGSTRHADGGGDQAVDSPCSGWRSDSSAGPVGLPDDQRLDLGPLGV